MYLSNRRGDLEESDHDELELLLESFSKQVEEIVTEAESIEVNDMMTQLLTDLWFFSRLTSSLLKRLSSLFLTQIATLSSLSISRCVLVPIPFAQIFTPCQVSIATMGLGTGALVAGLFGMNVGRVVTLFRTCTYDQWWQLTSHMEEHPYAFYLMTCLSSGVALIVTWVALHKYISSSSSKKTVSDALILGSLKSDVLAFRVLKIWVGKQPNPGFLYHLEEDFQRVGRETPSELDVTGSLSDITSIPDLQCHGSVDHRSPCRISMLGSQELIWYDKARIGSRRGQLILYHIIHLLSISIWSWCANLITWYQWEVGYFQGPSFHLADRSGVEYSYYTSIKINRPSGDESLLINVSNTMGF